MTSPSRKRVSETTLDWQHAIEDATRAPSSHNSQPWRFERTPSGLNVYADLDRRLPVVDPDNRELYISCGAALEHLALSIAAQGAGCKIAIDHRAANPLVATVSLTSESTQSEDAALYAAISTRRTSRVAFDVMPLPKSVVTDLEATAQCRASVFRVVSDVLEQERLVSLIMQGDRLQYEDIAFRNELADWMRPNTSRARDGIQGNALGLSMLGAYVAPLAIRTFDYGDRQAARDHELVSASALVAVLCTPGDSKSDWIHCGQALGRVALTAAAAGFTMSYLNQAVEVPSTRDRLRELLGGQHYPQLVLRFGRAPSTPPSTRRKIDEVFTDHPSSGE